MFYYYFCFSNFSKNNDAYTTASHIASNSGLLKELWDDRSIEGISKNMLTQQLREMESNKIINRKIYAEIPPRVEYSLTKKGESLLPIIKSLADWGSNHQND